MESKKRPATEPLINQDLKITKKSEILSPQPLKRTDSTVINIDEDEVREEIMAVEEMIRNSEKSKLIKVEERDGDHGYDDDIEHVACCCKDVIAEKERLMNRLNISEERDGSIIKKHIGIVNGEGEFSDDFERRVKFIWMANVKSVIDVAVAAGMIIPAYDVNLGTLKDLLTRMLEEANKLNHTTDFKTDTLSYTVIDFCGAEWHVVLECAYSIGKGVEIKGCRVFIKKQKIFKLLHVEIVTSYLYT